LENKNSSTDEISEHEPFIDNIAHVLQNAKTESNPMWDSNPRCLRYTTKASGRQTDGR